MIGPEDPDPDYTPEDPWLPEQSYPRLVRPDDVPQRRHLQLGSHIELRDITLDDLQRVGPVIYSEGAFYRYSRGVFAELPESDIYESVAKRDGAPCGEKNKPLKLRHSDLTSVIASLRMGQERNGFFDHAPVGVAFSNGFRSVPGELAEHSPANKARYLYDFDFVDADGPVGWLRFLQQVWADTPDIHERIECLRQFMGLCICGVAPRFQSALVLFGEGSNGKSVISEVLTACMPDNSTCSIPPQEMGHEYSRALLAGKLLNVVSELPEQDILNNESWKAIIAGDQIKARHIRQPPFMFAPIAGHLYSANRLPGTQDHTKGFWRRLIVLTFDQVFEGARRELGLAKRLIRDERAAIVNWAIEGTEQAIAQGRYTVPPSSNDAVDQWRKQADQVALFVEEMTAPLALDESPALGTRRAQLYSCYRGWCERNGHRPLARPKFGQRLTSLGVHSSRPWGDDDDRPRYYLVRVRDED